VLLLSAILVSCDNSVDRIAPVLTVRDGIMAKDTDREVMAAGHLYSDSPVADKDGNIYFAEGRTGSSKDFAGQIIKRDTQLQPEVFSTGTAAIQGPAFKGYGFEVLNHKISEMARPCIYWFMYASLK